MDSWRAGCCNRVMSCFLRIPFVSAISLSSHAPGKKFFAYYSIADAAPAPNVRHRAQPHRLANRRLASPLKHSGTSAVQPLIRAPPHCPSIFMDPAPNNLNFIVLHRNVRKGSPTARIARRTTPEPQFSHSVACSVRLNAVKSLNLDSLDHAHAWRLCLFKKGDTSRACFHATAFFDCA